ncbi:MAG: hypothetical protein GVY26_06410 [Bacteroidetes bacterium]|jgi:hypothetical protein|nr:hypothetical protein [Bacteroidota bacterium]
MRYATFLLFAFWLAAVGTSDAQPIIRLKNPSFEDEPQHSLPPRGWEDRGFHGESPPDTQPSGDFGVTQKPFHGQSYLGMVVRDNDTWECVAQEIGQPMLKDSCYQLVLHACQSPYYVSISRATAKEVNFNQPCRLRLWGARKKGGKGYELLAETPLVDHQDWQRYTLSFRPTMDITYIYLEAYYSSDGVGAYNGNVLVDGMSGIVGCGEN